MKQIIKKALSLLSIVSVLLSAASCCSLLVSIAAGDNPDITDLVVADIYDSTDENYHNLSADGVLQVSGLIDSDEDFILLQALVTNSTKITVTNNSGATAAVYLYYDYSDNPIQQFSLGNAETKSFDNLTSRFRYSISIGADIDTQLNLTITD